MILCTRTRLASRLRELRRAARGGQLVTLVVVLAAGGFSYRAGAGSASARPFAGEATAAAAALQARYAAGSYRDTRSWQSANALAATIDYMRATGSRAYLSDLDASYRAHHATDRFRGSYYDDEGWWALTWIDAYDLTGQARYLNQARDIFADMTGGWDSTCGGGIWWSKARSYKNAIANELFLAVAAHLHRLSPGDAADAAWALREWSWFQHSGMITNSHLVVDGLAGCRPILASPTWTYNQGVLIGALATLAGFSHDPSVLRTARDTADAVIDSGALSPHGILREPCEPSGCAIDQRIFKGVFMRNLKRLYDRVGDPRYQVYMLANANSVVARDRRGDGFGLHWDGPFDRDDTAAQAAALDVLNTQAGCPGPAGDDTAEHPASRPAAPQGPSHPGRGPGRWAPPTG